MKRFIAAVTGLTKDDEKSFIEFFKERGMGWWHRIDNVWLIATSKDDIGAAEIRDFLHNIKDSRVSIVSEVDVSTWAGFGPKSTVDETFSWVERNWKES